MGLHLTGNQFSGAIPSQLGDLVNLQDLQLYANQLTGTIPPQLGNLTQLTKLYLSQNQLTGSIPPELGNLTKLLYLYLNDNQLSGPIPPELGNLTKVVRFYIQNNQLSGNIPTTLMNMTALNAPYLDIGKNHLYSDDPDLREWLDVKDPDWELTQTILNEPPTADAGSGQTVHPGDSIILDGSNSFDPDEHYPLTYFWTIVEKPADSQAVLIGADQVSTSITIDTVGDFLIRLQVTDALGLTSAPSEILLSTVNAPPVAFAGDDLEVTLIGTQVTLDGSQSWDPENDNLYYSWSFTQKPYGSTVSLSGVNTANPGFVPDLYGAYHLILTVSDPWGASGTDDVIVSFDNIAPVADAGDNQSGIVGNVIYFDGSSSFDANGDSVTYSWTVVVKPEGSAAVLVNPYSATASIQPDEHGEYIVGLTVNDGLLGSLPDTAAVTVISIQDALTDKLQQVITDLNGLPSSAFKNKNIAKTLTRKVGVILKKVDKGNYQGAYSQLLEDISSKTDGCASLGSPDNNDWIITCPNQAQVYPLILEALNLLSELI
jgi:hypothetical protein